MVLGALKTQEEIAAKRCASMVGSTERVLEERNEKNGFCSAVAPQAASLWNSRRRRMDRRIQKCKVTEARNWILRGECETKQKRVLTHCFFKIQ